MNEPKRLLLLPLLVALGCGSSTAGDGEILSCTCDVAYVNDNDGSSYYMGSMDVPLCETDFTKSHQSDAESQCVSLLGKTDDNDANHTCACSCVHLAERCYAK